MPKRVREGTPLVRGAPIMTTMRERPASLGQDEPLTALRNRFGYRQIAQRRLRRCVLRHGSRQEQKDLEADRAWDSRTDSKTDSRTDSKGIRIGEFTHSSRLASRYIHSPAEAEEPAAVLWRHLIGKSLVFASAVAQKSWRSGPGDAVHFLGQNRHNLALVYSPLATTIKTGDSKRDLWIRSSRP